MSFKCQNDSEGKLSLDFVPEWMLNAIPDTDPVLGGPFLAIVHGCPPLRFWSFKTSTETKIQAPSLNFSQIQGFTTCILYENVLLLGTDKPIKGNFSVMFARTRSKW